MQFETGAPVGVVVREIAISRREQVKELLAASGFDPSDRERAVSVLRAIAGAKTVLRELTPVWTMPGNEANTGHLTSEFHRIVGGTAALPEQRGSRSRRLVTTSRTRRSCGRR